MAKQESGGRSTRQIQSIRSAAIQWAQIVGGLLACASAWGQMPVDPARIETEQLLRQQDRERALRGQSEAEPDVHLQAPPAKTEERFPADERPCFPIQRIALKNGSDFAWALSAASLPDDPAEGRCLGSQGVNLAMKRIQNAIIARGFVTTRVLAGAQDLKAGTLELTIVPGRIRQTRLTADSGSRANLRNALPASPGDLLNLRDIEQALENLKRVPTADADIQIAPAEGPDGQPGESDLVVKWRQDSIYRLSVSADDSGTEATGKDQGSITLSLDNPLALNDLFYVTRTRNLRGDPASPHGTHGDIVHYSVPFGYWLVGLTASRNGYYQAVAGATQTYRYSGTSSNAEIKLSRLVYRDEARKIGVSLKAWQRTSHNYVEDLEIEPQRRRMGGWEAGVEHRQSFGNSSLTANLNYRQGTGAFHSLPAPEENRGEGTSRPRFFTADAQLTVPFNLSGQNFRYGGTWRGQWNRTALIPQDRFALGGRYTIRGYDGENVISAERGWLLRNELGLILGESRQELYVGLDHGEVGGPSAATLASNRLTGVVAGWRGSYKDFTYDLFVGEPVGKPESFITPARTTGFNLTWSI